MKRAPLRFFISTILLLSLLFVFNATDRLEDFMQPAWFGILCLFVITFMIHLIVDLLLIKFKIGK